MLLFSQAAAHPRAVRSALRLRQKHDRGVSKHSSQGSARLALQTLCLCQPFVCQDLSCLFFLKLLFIDCLLLALLGLGCYTWAFSRCRERGLVSSWSVWTYHCGDFAVCGTRASGIAGSGPWRTVDAAVVCEIVPRSGLEPVSPALARPVLYLQATGEPVVAFLHERLTVQTQTLGQVVASCSVGPGGCKTEWF